MMGSNCRNALITLEDTHKRIDTIKDEVIVCFGYATWGECKDDQEVMLLLSKHNKILYVEAQRSFRLKEVFSSIRNSFKNILKTKGSNYRVLTVPRLPYLVKPYLPRFLNESIFLMLNCVNKRILGAVVGRYIKSLDLIPTMVWVYNPYDLPVVKSFPKQMTVYRVYDEVNLFPLSMAIQKAVESIEAKYINKVGLIFASSRRQFAKREKKHIFTYFIPNAVNFDLFNSALTNSFSRPQELHNINPPIIGFIGGIDYRMDFNIVRYIAEQRPDWSILLIGPMKKSVGNDIKLMDGIRNIYFVSEKKQKELPGYLKFVDVSIIPYKVNESTRTMYIGKLHEHLAAGKPIVSTSLPEIEPFKDIVRITEDKEQFLKCVEEELLTDSEDKIRKRVEVARENTWEKRIHEIQRIIERKRNFSTGMRT